jgi:Gas vesicle synthesis protein GvpO
VADLTDAQRKRADARQKRRKPSDEPADEPESSNDDGQEPHHAVKQAAKVAAAVGAAGAAAAAARALTSHDDDEPKPDEGAPEEADDQPAAQAEPSQEAQEEPEPVQQEQPERQDEEEEREPVAGAPASDARKTIERAREQLEELLERPVETVSSLERTHDGWVAALEVVEVKRIPETTDVMASYEMELDDDLNLRRYQQVRRYNRSQANREDGG